MNLSDYPTPLTDAALAEGLTADSAYAFMRDLERKLAMCRDALRSLRTSARISGDSGKLKFIEHVLGQTK